MLKRTRSINKFTFRKNFKIKPIALSLLVAFSVAACGGSDDTEQLTIYSDVQDCISNNPNMANECRVVYNNAVQEAIETAPKYATVEECTADFGLENCQPIPTTAANSTENSAIVDTQQASSGGFFMPLLAGYMMGKMMSGMGANNMAHKPVYSPKDATGRPTNFYDSSGKSYGAAQSGRTVNVPKSDLKSKTAGTVQRGGFGKMVSQQRLAAQPKQNTQRSATSRSTGRSTSFGG